MDVLRRVSRMSASGTKELVLLSYVVNYVRANTAS